MRYGTDSVEAAQELLKLSGLWCKDKEKEKRGFIAYRHAVGTLKIYKYDECKSGFKNLVNGLGGSLLASGDARNKRKKSTFLNKFRQEFEIYSGQKIERNSEMKKLEKLRETRNSRKY